MVRQTVDDYLSDRIGTALLDERLWSIRRTTEDQTVRFVVGKLWWTYSDAADDLVRLGKRGWNCVQRMLLLLDSGAKVRDATRWIWHPSQMIAGITLAAVLSVVLAGNFLLLPLIAGGMISIALAASRQRVRASTRRPDPFCAWPFPTLAVIERALTRSPGFRKQKHRAEIVAQRCDARVGDVALSGPAFMVWSGWCLISPIVVAFQRLPIRVSCEIFSEPHGMPVDTV